MSGPRELHDNGVHVTREGADDRRADTLRLGLIGDNIARSSAPRLHHAAAELCGIALSYERLVPRTFDLSFDELFDRCASSGYRGVNVTYPYKEQAASRAPIREPRLRTLGGINTVLFDPTGPAGYNTDYSGFISAYRRRFAGEEPGTVCLLGAGGVGKAVAFALLAFGLRELRIVERDRGRADQLASALRGVESHLRIDVSDDPSRGADGADGVVNCTPIGMVGLEGTPLERRLMRRATWAFDAVYTPLVTRFLKDADDEGLRVLSGYELFFYQGIDAFERFTGRRPDEDALRSALAGDASDSSSESTRRPENRDAR